MSTELRFALDTNIFIEAQRRYYAFDLCPGFWETLLWNQGKGIICSIDRVREEIEHGGDDLAQWVKRTMPKACFASTDDDAVVRWFGEMVSWVQAQQQFSSEAKAEFASVADGWLIAYAKANQLVLVTHEVFSPEARRKVPIPNVCNAFDVDYADTFEMLRHLRTRFTWQRPA